MKKKLLTATFIALGGVYIQAQTIVSTTPQNKNAVLEMLTGVKCQACPYGHMAAKQFYNNNPGKVVLISIHEGGYATPSGGYPDFRTSFGTAIASNSGALGYPAGTINRRNFPGYEQTDNNNNPVSGILAQGYNSYATTGAMVLQESSPVNLGAHAYLDLTSRVLTVTVEAYYTANASLATNKINVALLQNNIEGPQVNSEANPSNVLPNGNYIHSHMLRRLLTGQWGEDITTTNQGDLFQKTYTYTLPAHLNNVEYDPSNLEIAVYVANSTDGKTDVLTGVTVPVEYDNYPYAYEANLLKAIVPAEYCGDSYRPEVEIRNEGGTNLTSLQFDYSINGGANKTHLWFGNLAYFKKEVVKLPAISFTPDVSNNVQITISKPNLQTDEVTTNNSKSATFAKAIESSYQLTFTLKTDNYPTETSWELLSSDGTQIAGVSSYSSALQTYTYNIELPETDCYEFKIYDSFGDGIAGDGTSTRGNFELKDENGVIIASNNGTVQFSTFEKPFGATRTVSSVKEMSNNNFVSVYPNPFSSNTNIKIHLTKSDNVEYTLVNVLGEVILRENKGTLPAGNHLFDLDGNQLSNGFYQLQVKVGNTINSSKLVVNH
jgi:hypothetical protein